MLSKPYRCIGQPREGLLTFDPPSSEMHFSRLSIPAFTIRARYAVFSALTLSFIASFALMFLLYHRRQTVSRGIFGKYCRLGRDPMVRHRNGVCGQRSKADGASFVQAVWRRKGKVENPFYMRLRRFVEPSALSRQLSVKTGRLPSMYKPI